MSASTATTDLTMKLTFSPGAGTLARLRADTARFANRAACLARVTARPASSRTPPAEGLLKAA